MPELIENLSYTHGDSVLISVSEGALDPKERSCCICLQPFGPTLLIQGGSEVPVQLPCGHIFGEACILSWTLTNNSCPLCRRGVFGVDDHPADRRFPTHRNSNADGPSATEQDDIWLDVDVWDSPAQVHRLDAVSFAEIETLIEFYVRDLSNANLSDQPEASSERLSCVEHGDFYHFSDEEDTSNEVVAHERLPPPSTAQISQTDTDIFELTGVGSQFADLGYRYSQWMDEYLNEPSFEQYVFVSRP